MTIRRVSLHNVRSYSLASFELDPAITLILGRNGSGKTTLLEAVYILLRGTSFRGRDRDVLAHDQQTSEMKLELNGGEKRRVRLKLVASDKVNKEFEIDTKTTARLPAGKRLPVVLFEPDELRLLSSSPQRRRQFIDDVLSRLYPEYGTLLARYTRTLMQRNELLKQRGSMSEDTWDSHLFAWDVKFTELAEAITNHRRAFISLSNERLSELYSKMAGANHTVLVSYSDVTSPDAYRQLTLRRLSSGRHGDALRGYTSVGPHREDILINLDKHPAGETASRGEMRTIMLSYKLLEVTLQEELSDQRPVILMDDVFSELDAVRERQLMVTLKGYQTIITATDLRDSLKDDVTIIALKSD